MLDMSNLTNTAKKLSHSELQTDTLTERQSLLTCVSSSSPVQPNSIEELRMWLVAAFPASHSQLPESKQEQMTPEICGLQQPTLFAQSDLPAFSWKTYQDYCSSTTPKVFSLTLPKWGMWDATGLYPQPMWEPDTDGNDCGSLESWATPRANSAMASAITADSAWDEKRFPNLETQVGKTHFADRVSDGDWLKFADAIFKRDMKNWPSPTCSDVYTGNLKSTQQKPGSMHSVTLPQALAMWPTPDANMGARGTQPEWKPVRDSGHTATYTINQAVRDTWQTPTASMHKGSGRNETMRSRLDYDVEKGTDKDRGEKSLNPDWVEWLMGWPVGFSDIKPLTELTWRDWQTDPADIGEVPRVTDVKENRANRLKAIGNGQVPQCVVKAWELLA